LSGLESFTHYKIKIGFCNSQGCTYSDYQTCQTLASLPSDLPKPHYTDLSDQFKLAVNITWSKPQKPNGIITEYKLYRLTVKTSVIFKPLSYQVDTSRDNMSEVVYTGVSTHFTDYNLIANSTYEYVVEVVTQTGSTLSLPCRFRTRTMLASVVTETGRLILVTNEAVVLDLKAPLRLNGHVESVFVELMSASTVKKIEVSQNRDENDDTHYVDRFLKSLQGVRIDRLKANENYEVKSIFCNLAGCVTSENALRFRTRDDDRFREFNAKVMSPTRVDFDWRFTFGDEASTEIVK
jgi:hypothetical protein